MERVYIKDLRAGEVLGKALFTPSGLKLLPAGTRLSRARLSSLRRAFEGELFLANSYAELRSELAGEIVAAATSGHGMGRRRMNEESPEHEARREWMREIRRMERMIDEQVDMWTALERRVEPAARAMEVAESGRVGWPSAARLRAYRDDRVARIARLHTSVVMRETPHASEAVYLVRELMDLYCGYPDRYARLATMASGDGDPIAEHAFRVCALSVSIAVQMGWSAGDVERVGLAGMLADLGMLLEPLESRLALDDVSVSRLRRHPIASAVMMTAFDDVPEGVRLAVAQHHERLDGRGYPLGVRGNEIHAYAKVLAVADCFAAAVSPRPHRPARRPHAALVNVCRDAIHGALDRRVTMALVRVTGVFPVGAAVTLGDGEAAVVTSSRAEAPGRPTLRLLGELAELDLREAKDVRITAERSPSESEMLAA